MRIEPCLRAHNQHLFGLRELRCAEVHHRQIANINLVARRIIPGMRNDSNNGNRNGLRVAVSRGDWIVYLSPDWIDAREKLLRGKFINHSRCGMTTDICRPKISAAQNLPTKRAGGSATVMVNTPRGSNPSGTCCERQNLFSVDPAAASNTAASATCATTSAPRARCRCAPLLPRAASSCNSLATEEVFETRNAGHIPTSNPANTEMIVVIPSTTPSIFVS